MSRQVTVNEMNATRRRVYFHIVAADGIVPADGEAGGQPQISIDGAAWTATGIGVLSLIGSGRYHATLTQSVVSAAGRVIETRYASASTAECPGDTIVVVEDPAAAPAATLSGSSDLPYAGEVSVVNGDAYTSARGRALSWTYQTGDDLTGADWTLRIYDGIRESDGVVLSVAASAVAVGGGYVVTAELTAPQTAALSVRFLRRVLVPRRFEVVAVVNEGEPETQFYGTLNVTE
jgi:hypothetical protein